jgi:2-aminoadipate transaminase
MALAAELAQTWSAEGPHGALLGSSNVRGLVAFRETYQGMGAANGDREQAANQQVPPGTEIISMGGGMPEHALLPFDELLRYAKVAAEKNGAAPLEYGQSSLLRAEIAKYLTRSRGAPVAPDELFVTTGNQGGISNVCTALLGPGDVALIESPLWTSTVTIVKGTGADVVAVARDREGPVLAEVEEAAAAARVRGQAVKVLYLQGLFHNPEGTCLSPARAEALLRLAARLGAVIVSDEAYEAYNFMPGGARPPFLSALSGGHGVITVHTFSKTLGTGLRLGYLHASPALLAPLNALRLTNASVFWEYAVGELMADGAFDRIVERARASYSAKLDVFGAAIAAQAGAHMEYERPDGGFFVWLRLKPHLSSREVHLAMIGQGVMGGLGETYFGPGKHDQDNHLRLAFIGRTADELREAARRIGAACEEAAAGLWAEAEAEAAEVARL